VAYDEYELRVEIVEIFGAACREDERVLEAEHFTSSALRARRREERRLDHAARSRARRRPTAHVCRACRSTFGTLRALHAHWRYWSARGSCRPRPPAPRVANHRDRADVHAALSKALYYQKWFRLPERVAYEPPRIAPLPAACSCEECGAEFGHAAGLTTHLSYWRRLGIACAQKIKNNTA
jgi:hypothetical protein